MKNNKLVVFSLDKLKFAIHLSNIERIIRVVEIDPLPLAPEYISGTINLRGEFIAVMDMRKIFMLPQREVELSDQLIIARTSKSKIALLIDSVNEIVERSDEEIFTTDRISLNVGYVEGLFRLKGGMVLIHNPDRLFTNDQISRLNDALKKQKANVHIKKSEK